MIDWDSAYGEVLARENLKKKEFEKLNRLKFEEE